MQLDIPVNPCAAKLLGQKSCLRLRRMDLYHPNDSWALEGAFLLLLLFANTLVVEIAEADLSDAHRLRSSTGTESSKCLYARRKP